MAEPQAPTEDVYRKILESAKNNDSTLTQINLNNLENGGSKPEWMIELIDALIANTNVETVQLVNCNINNEGGKKIADLIIANKKIINLNLETNRIGTDGMKAIAESLEKNDSLVELKLTNQVN
jgi:Ran GTPase-activating protein (RanGAP) involved in mRNA processing and transport